MAVVMGFESMEQVAAWAEANGGQKALRVAIRRGIFGNDKRSIAFAEEWLSQVEVQRERKRSDALNAEERALREREVAAQESAAESARRSTVDAKRSADAAIRAARWTFVAAAVAGVALIVSIVAYVRPPHTDPSPASIASLRAIPAPWHVDSTPR